MIVIDVITTTNTDFTALGKGVKTQYIRVVDVRKSDGTGGEIIDVDAK